MFKHKEIKGVLICLLIIVLVSWSKFIFTRSLKVDDNPLGNVEGWVVFILFSLALFLFGRFYYRFYKNSEQSQLSHRQIKTLGYLFIVIASFMLPILSNDVFIYMAYGDVSNMGIDVFSTTNVVQHSRWIHLVGDWKDAPYSYGPISLWVGKIANWVGGTNLFGVLISYKIIWLLLAIGFIEIISLTVKHISDLIWICITPIFWLQCIGSIHYDMLAGFFLLIAIYFISQQKIVFSFIAIAIAVMTKMVFVIFVPYIIIHYFLINPTRITIKPILYFTIGLVAFAIVTIASYWPFWNGIDTIKTPFAFLNKVEPSKSFSEVAGELLNLAFPRDGDTSVTNEMTNGVNSESKRWWWKQCQFAMNIFGMAVGLTLTTIFIVKTKLKLNRQLLSEYWVKLTLVFFFFYSHVFNIWYLIALLPFIPLLGHHQRLKKYLLIVAVYSNLHMIMLNINHDTILYYLNPIIILINICLFIWQFRKNFLTIESPIVKPLQHG